MRLSIAAVPCALVLTATLAVAQPAKPRQQQVQFAKGASTAEIKGQVKGDSYIDYIVRAAAGQTLTVSLKRTNTGNFFNLLPPGSEDVAMFVGDEVDTVTRVLPADGDYKIRVYLVRAAARRKEVSNYTLSVKVTGTPLAALPAAQDALVKGTRYHAKAQITCVMPFASDAKPCDAGVVRRGRDGSATLEILGANGVVRRILFVKGKPTASDGTGELTFTRQNDRDLTIVKIAPDERYDVVDAFIIGG
jgi:hypothetical protein